MTAIVCNRLDPALKPQELIVTIENICFVGPITKPWKDMEKNSCAISMTNGATFAIDRSVGQMKQIMGVKVK